MSISKNALFLVFAASLLTFCGGGGSGSGGSDDDADADSGDTVTLTATRGTSASSNLSALKFQTTTDVTGTAYTFEDEEPLATFTVATNGGISFEVNHSILLGSEDTATTGATITEPIALELDSGEALIVEATWTVPATEISLGTVDAGSTLSAYQFLTEVYGADFPGFTNLDATHKTALDDLSVGCTVAVLKATAGLASAAGAGLMNDAFALKAPIELLISDPDTSIADIGVEGDYSSKSEMLFAAMNGSLSEADWGHLVDYAVAQDSSLDATGLVMARSAALETFDLMGDMTLAMFGSGGAGISALVGPSGQVTADDESLCAKIVAGEVSPSAIVTAPMASDNTTELTNIFVNDAGVVALFVDMALECIAAGTVTDVMLNNAFALKGSLGMLASAEDQSGMLSGGVPVAGAAVVLTQFALNCTGTTAEEKEDCGKMSFLAADNVGVASLVDSGGTAKTNEILSLAGYCAGLIDNGMNPDTTSLPVINTQLDAVSGDLVTGAGTHATCVTMAATAGISKATCFTNAIYTGSTCNNNICEGTETVMICPTDCTATAKAVEPLHSCGNGMDDDGDTLVDCADTDCSTHTNCTSTVPTETTCANNHDDDGDGLTDCADSDCSSKSACLSVSSDCGNGTCSGTETVALCPNDCSTVSLTNCGNGSCEAGIGETSTTCPGDCQATTCGNGTCGAGESNLTCPADCTGIATGTGTTGTTGTGTGSGTGTATSCNNNGICESINGETIVFCPADCH